MAVAGRGAVRNVSQLPVPLVRTAAACSAPSQHDLTQRFRHRDRRRRLARGVSDAHCLGVHGHRPAEMLFIGGLRIGENSQVSLFVKPKHPPLRPSLRWSQWRCRHPGTPISRAYDSSALRTRPAVAPVQ